MKLKALHINNSYELSGIQAKLTKTFGSTATGSSNSGRIRSKMGHPPIEISIRTNEVRPEHFSPEIMKRTSGPITEMESVVGNSLSRMQEDDRD